MCIRRTHRRPRIDRGDAIGRQQGGTSWRIAVSKLTFMDRRAAFADGSDSPRALLEQCLGRIAERDGEVHAFVTVNTDGARAAADAATARYRAGKPLSSIDGMPIALKDIFETVDMPTTFGSPIFAGWRGGRDSAVAFALRQAGAVLIGKAVTTEFAASFAGPTRNPHGLDRTPGGSSSGSAAAVADGMVPVAIGSQVVGSVLRPASFCGVIGLKPTYGAINKGGICDSYSQNCVGTLSNSLADAYAVCHEIATRVGGDPGYAPFQGGAAPALSRAPQRLGVLETAGWHDADAEAKRQFMALLARLIGEGVQIVDRRASPHIERLEHAITDARDVSSRINAWEGLWPFAELQQRHGDQFSESYRGRMRIAAEMTADDYLAALKRRDAMRSAFDELSGQVDALATLSAPGPAPRGLQSTGNPVFNAVATALRVPAISLPLMQVDGMPVGVQLIGFAGGEGPLSAFAQYLIDLK
jgi:Asp-tRNA(Asn)/Glu-tRNA(Gln) amidotransferase A subunit family amidase